MKNCIKKYIKVTPIYVVIIFNNKDVRWEIFKDYQTLNDVKKLIETKYNITKFGMEIYDENIINYFSKIKSYITEENKNGLDIHIYTKCKINLPRED
jgi:hypothetical protein